MSGDRNFHKGYVGFPAPPQKRLRVFQLGEWIFSFKPLTTPVVNQISEFSWRKRRTRNIFRHFQGVHCFCGFFFVSFECAQRAMPSCAKPFGILKMIRPGKDSLYYHRHCILYFLRIMWHSFVSAAQYTWNGNGKNTPWLGLMVRWCQHSFGHQFFKMSALYLSASGSFVGKVC